MSCRGDIIHGPFIAGVSSAAAGACDTTLTIHSAHAIFRKIINNLVYYALTV